MTFIDLRGCIIANLRIAAQEMLLRPGPIANADKQVVAMIGVLDAWIKMVSVSHTSSSLVFALKDLPSDEREDYQNAKHLLDTLDRLYVEPTRDRAV